MFLFDPCASQAEALKLQVEMLEDKLEQAQGLGTPPASAAPSPSMTNRAEARISGGAATTDMAKELRELKTALEQRDACHKWVCRLPWPSLTSAHS